MAERRNRPAACGPHKPFVSVRTGLGQSLSPNPSAMTLSSRQSSGFNSRDYNFSRCAFHTRVLQAVEIIPQRREQFTSASYSSLWTIAALSQLKPR